MGKRWKRGLACLVVLGCGPAGPGSGWARDASGSGGNATEADGGSGETDAVSQCGAYLDATEWGVPTTFRIVNGTDAMIMLPFSCTIGYLVLTSTTGQHWPGPLCDYTCAARFEYGCQTCEPCESGANWGLRPGETRELEWSGELFEDVTPPMGCFREDCQGQCSRQASPITGTNLTATALAVSLAACEAHGDACTCAQPAGEGCAVRTHAAADLESSTSFSVGATVVEVVF